MFTMNTVVSYALAQDAHLTLIEADHRHFLPV